MIDPIRELKTRAELLHRKLKNSQPGAIARLRRLPDFRTSSDSDAELVRAVQRKHCLSVIASEFGFSNWAHAKRLLEGADAESDFGELLYINGPGGFLNHWFANWDEANAQRVSSGGFLLAFKRQFVVVEPEYIRSIGLDPDDADWARLGWDWARPKELEARMSLYGKLIAARSSEDERK